MMMLVVLPSFSVSTLTVMGNSFSFARRREEPCFFMDGAVVAAAGADMLLGD